MWFFQRDNFFRIFCGFLVAYSTWTNVIAQDECLVTNNTFKSGEEVTYIIAYDWFVIWTDVGQVKITITDTTYNGQPAYRYSALGETYKSWRKIFKVRDIFQTIVDTGNLKPYVSSRNIREGKYRQWDHYRYDYADSLTYAETSTNDNPVKYDTIPITPCTYDIMSALLYARNIDFSSYKVGTQFPVTILLDKEAYPIYFQYLGIEDYKLKHVGTFECIKFSVMLIEGDVFKDGDNMTVWATNDKNRIVVYAESPILVGSVKARVAKIRGNRFPVNFKKDD